ncbi:hypothetical protein [Segniliparus rugosus]|nr:hypothetical protein [Segniliparus rugosus]
MRIRPEGRADQGDDPFEQMRIRPAAPAEAGQSSPYGAPAQQPQQGFPPSDPNFYPAQQAPSPYAPQGGFPPPQAPNPYAPQGFPAQPTPNPYGQQPSDPYAAALPEGAGQLAFDTGFFWLAWIFALTGVSVSVDGVERIRTWGKQLVVVPPGQHFVEVYTRYLWPVGRASLPVFVQPGQTVPVFYKAPTIAWLKGAIGHEPQKAPGLILTVVLLAVGMLFACVVPLLSLAITGS